MTTLREIWVGFDRLDKMLLAIVALCLIIAWL